MYSKDYRKLGSIFWTFMLLLLTQYHIFKILTTHLETTQDFASLPDFNLSIQRLPLNTLVDHTVWPTTDTYVYLWIKCIRFKLLKHKPLSFNERSHKLTLLLLGGIHPNPGPRRPRYPCGVCAYACKTGAIACNECEQWIHKECVGMSTSLYTRLGDSSDPWYCPSCHNVNASAKTYSLPHQSPDISTSPQPQRTPNLPNRVTTTPGDKNSKLSDSTRLSSSLETTVSSTSSYQSDSTQDNTIDSLNESDKPQQTSSPKSKQHNPQQKTDMLRILSINFQSLCKKGKLLEAIVEDCDPDVILGSETWLDSKIKTSEILPSFLGYEINRRDRPNEPYGGVLIASKKDLQIHNIHCSQTVVMISGSITLSKRKKTSFSFLLQT